MELVYLWVEEYKNIKQQGFDFSPRFKCDFEGENLTITKNKDYKSLFPENINITAIVGENGSGKSSIIEEILNEEKKSCKKIDFNYKKKQLYLLNNDKKIEKIEFKNFLSKNNILIYSEHKNSELYKSKYHFNDYLKEELKLNEEDQHINVPISYMATHSVLDKIDEFKFLPNYFELSLNSRLCKNDSDCIFHGFSSKTFSENVYEFIEDEISKFYELIQEYLNTIVNNFNNNHTKEILKQYLYLKEFLYLLSTHDHEKSFILLKDFLENEDLDKLSSKIDTILLGEKEKMIIDDFLSIYDNKENTESKPILIDLKKYDYSNLMKNLYRGYFHIKFLNIRDSNKVYFDNLSFGEQELLKFFSKLFYIIKNINFENNFYIFIDEIESSFHPNWQKSLIKYLVVFIENLKLKNNFNFIVTTHSPFVLSDLPKENVIFLEKYKKEDKDVKQKRQEIGNCKNVSNCIDIKQTFGANIHTLLSHGFFMSDGLMGEFAKEKIRTIQVAYKYILHRNKQKSLNKKEHKKSRRFIKIQLKNLWYIQAIIGEKFLQTIMKNNLQEMEQILFGNEKAIDNEIERLQNLKKSIKNAKN